MRSRQFGDWTGSDTPAVFGLLVIMLVFFVAGFFIPGLGQDLVAWLGWPIEPQWFAHLRFWQMLTYPLVHADFLSMLFDGLVIFFFGSVLERTWGTPRFLAFFFLCGIVAGLAAIGMQFLFPRLPGGFFLGMTGHFVALGVAYGALNPSARIYIYFVLPIEARWLGWISIALELFMNARAYGSIPAALVAIALSALFAVAFTRGIGFRFPPRGGGGPGLRDRFERWRQRQRMRAWQRKVSKANKPEDLFKDR
jgi:membrane associated rhomboid family serine protease